MANFEYVWEWMEPISPLSSKVFELPGLQQVRMVGDSFRLISSVAAFSDLGSCICHTFMRVADEEVGHLGKISDFGTMT